MHFKHNLSQLNNNIESFVETNTLDENILDRSSQADSILALIQRNGIDFEFTKKVSPEEFRKIKKSLKNTLEQFGKDSIL